MSSYKYKNYPIQCMNNRNISLLQSSTWSVLQRNPDEFVSLFEKLIFHGAQADFTEVQLARYMERFLHGLEVNWPASSDKDDQAPNCNPLKQER